MSPEIISSKSRSIEIYILVILVAIESFGALYGGINLVNDPSGESINLPLKLLEGSIFNNFIIPGIILFLALGFFPFMLIFPLLFKPKWPLMNVLNIYPSYHWAWTYTIYTAIMLISWINIQMMILTTSSVLQGVFGLMGVLILIVALSPRVKRFYKLHRHSRHHEILQD